MTPDAALRPSPDALLAHAAREGRGRLKIFIGAAPGVGKTWAMLDDAHRRRAEGVDVLAALIETHGRAETQAKLAGLPQLPRKPVIYKGRALTEMDLDGLLARRPALALIDELAHTNADTGRHEKRWQDVEEVLAAGIDVFTTLNVQHIETLNETVARITGVRVRETVPDRVLEMADEIELIDLPPDDLMARLKQGKIYPQDQAARALTSFFAKGNLTALRELALRAAADRVDAQLREHMAANAIAGPWPTQERILVCINESPAAREAIRVAKRSADRARAEWIALNVTQARMETLPEAEKDRLAGTLRLAERLGAELATLEAERDVAQAILSYAADRNVRRIVIGRPRRRPFWARLTTEDVATHLLRLSGRFEITVAAQPDEPAARPGWHLPQLGAEPRAWGEAVLAVALASACAFAAERLFPVASLSVIYMTAVVVVASRRGIAPAIGAAVIGFLAYNFLFTHPRYTFHVSRQGELLTLGLFLAASLITGNLAARLRARVDAQATIADRTNKLYDFSRRVAAAATADDVIWASVSHVATTLRCEAVLLKPSPAGELQVVGGFPPEDQLDIRDQSAAQFSWDKGEAAGRGSDTLPTARWFFLPLTAGERRLGVLGIAHADERPFARTDRRLLDALVDQIALALERLRLTEELSETRLASETDRLRTALLSSVSHDLRTPLVTIIGAAGSLAHSPDLPADARQDLAENIREEGERLDRYVQNLLDMTRLGHGALKPQVGPVDVAELVGTARHRLRAPLRGHVLETDVPDLLPLVLADGMLLEQVLVNVLDNAAKYAPAGSTIAIAARRVALQVELTVADTGPGIPSDERARVFDMFYRVAEGDRQRAGTGLGLAICKGLIEAMGGTIRAESASPDGGGTRIVIGIPLFNPENPA
ncbi:sensor histidine kinase [Frigidibacter mobilis]|uniref:histidine kinase n=1 Tax=Frigidibacter mobilis TaxID=1335048 RepID=A0A159Z9D1_9RHOB|nr:sensor histidine kinase KdpD [Frigidibacter mobilis]AMY71304.1 osmosensitive K channel signal transduction histidine kinase [Frigidibacter mobilis]